MSANTKAIIFDFDGTIADSLPVMIEIYKELLPGSPEIDKIEYNRLRKLPLQKIAGELGISFWKIPFLLRKGRKLMRKRLQEVEPFPEIGPVLSELERRGYKLYIVSSNSADNVNAFLGAYDMQDMFAKVDGGSGLFRKARALQRFMKKERIDQVSAWYIGDEARDIVAARRAGIPIMSVAWGFNDIELLKDMRPDAVAKKPADILAHFK